MPGPAKSTLLLPGAGMASQSRPPADPGPSLWVIGMYGMAEILASRVPRQEEYIARVPAIAILPWFLAGALFPITALPGFLTWVAKFLPLTQGLALMRYGLRGDGMACTRSGG